MSNSEQSVEHFSRFLPFPKGDLWDDERMGRVWEHVVVLKDRALLQWFGGRRLLWAHLDGEQIVSLQLVPTTETAATFNRHGWRIRPQEEAQITAIMTTRTTYEEAYSALFPHQLRRYWVSYPTQPLPMGGLRHHARIETIRPARRAILRTDEDSIGRIVDWDLQQGAEGIKREQELKRFSSSKGP